MKRSNSLKSFHRAFVSTLRLPSFVLCSCLAVLRVYLRYDNSRIANQVMNYTLCTKYCVPFNDNYPNQHTPWTHITRQTTCISTQPTCISWSSWALSKAISIHLPIVISALVWGALSAYTSPPSNSPSRTACDSTHVDLIVRGPQ